ncbi:MAG: magnesium-translocating P-type ATPase [Candidatus Buchananbacteria bacterium]
MVEQQSSAKVLPVDLFKFSQMTQADSLAAYKVKEVGLTNQEAVWRLGTYGLNVVSQGIKIGLAKRFFNNLKDPLSALLLALGVISYLTKDYKAAILILVMLLMSVILRYFQETKADQAAAKLKALIHTTATVLRNGQKTEVLLESVVPGDIIQLSAGDMIPADIRLIDSRDLFVNQAVLTGESLPAEKHAITAINKVVSQYELANICFMGTNVESGTATALVLTTGQNTQFGSLADDLSVKRQLTNFDLGINRFTWLMIRFIAILVPLVFVINGFSKGNWLEAFLFALAVAVGLTPELLPMIVTVNLSKGALDMSKKKVIVKRLNAIQNFGAMDVFCMDKTGTLTEGKVSLIKHLDITGKENEKILAYAYLNSYYQTGLKNLLDFAVLQHDQQSHQDLIKQFSKIDEVPFDFIRRRMSVVVGNNQGQHLLICKGAVEEVLANCQQAVVKGKIVALAKSHQQQKLELIDSLSSQGFRLVALAYKELPSEKNVYTVADENNLTLLGFLAFLDPPKASAALALKQLAEYGIQAKVLTGDNELVTRKVCQEVDLPISRILLGSEIEKLTETELRQAVEEANIFDKLEPHHKAMVIKALQKNGHVVGFMGDGINDALALRAADVGVSVDSAVDIAKESSDIILLEKNLLVLKEGVREGRKIFSNIIKYIKMAASSNFGNMFSVIGGSVFLPFLPMLPIQVIANNLLYDFSQITIPTDSADEEYLKKPRQWQINKIAKFVVCLGPASSVFDYLTFFMMLFVFNTWFNPALFHTGWFVESLFTQTLIIHIIRTRKPFWQSFASRPLILSTLAVVSIGAYLPYSPLAATLGFVPLPLSFWGYLALMIACYFVLTEVVKRRFIKYFGWD